MKFLTEYVFKDPFTIIEDPVVQQRHLSRRSGPTTVQLPFNWTVPPPVQTNLSTKVGRDKMDQELDQATVSDRRQWFRTGMESRCTVSPDMTQGRAGGRCG